MGNTNSKIIICKNIRLEKDYKDVVNYTEAEMLELCQTHALASAYDYSFIRSERNVIKTSFSYGDALKCNYMAFQNPDYSNKWFFAFIDDVEYANDGTSKIHYTIDEFSTWFDYWDPEPCFVLREHTNDDSVGANTYPENQEKGEYIIGGSGAIASTYFNYTKFHVCIGVSWIPDNTPNMYESNRLMGNIYSGTYYLIFKTTADASKFIKAYASLGHVNDIQCLYMIPEVLATITSSTTWYEADLGGQTGITFITLHGSTSTIIIDDNISISMPTSIDSYTPKNKKLLCYPYSCLTISNNNGGMAEYHYEDFISNTPLFYLTGLQSPSCPMYIFPKNYKKDSADKSGYAWGLPLAKTPQGSWNADMYTNWMTQNGVNLFGMRIDAPTGHAISGSIQALVGAGTMSGEGIGGGISQMLAATQEMYRASMIPNQIGGQTTVGDVTYAFDKLAPTYYKMTIRAEYARKIDEFFTRFGYKTNRLKTPNQTGRTYFNYVQIGSTENIGYSSNSSRSVPSSSMEIINNIYRNGVTIWHSHDNIGNYSLNNTIVSS